MTPEQKDKVVEAAREVDEYHQKHCVRIPIPRRGIEDMLDAYAKLHDALNPSPLPTPDDLWLMARALNHMAVTSQGLARVYAHTLRLAAAAADEGWKPKFAEQLRAWADEMEAR